jgi:hypothetical protein
MIGGHTGKTERYVGITVEKTFRNDMILIASIIVAALLMYVGLKFVAAADVGTAMAVVTIDGEEYGRYPLAEDMEEKIELEDGNYNILTIEGGEADMTEASCPDKICVKHRAISRKNESIICLPNKVVVTIENGAESELDAVASIKLRMIGE